MHHTLQATDALGNTPLHYAAGKAKARSSMSLPALCVPTGRAKLYCMLSSFPTICCYHYRLPPLRPGYGRPDLVSLLLFAGADKTARNKNGKSAYDLAT
jgi:ankyrin repeat protein